MSLLINSYIGYKDMVEIIKNIHSIDNLSYPIPGVGVVSYLYIEDQNDLTLVDTCFTQMYQNWKII